MPNGDYSGCGRGVMEETVMVFPTITLVLMAEMSCDMYMTSSSYDERQRCR